MTTFFEKMTEDLTLLKEGIEALFQRARLQALRFTEKETSSFNELRHIQKRDQTLEDTFVEWNKIDSTEGLVFDKGTWTNIFRIKEVPFRSDLYTKTAYPMEINGNVIPGSRFAGIFLDQNEYWGYSSATGEDVPASFTLPFEIPTDQTSVEVNRIHLRTNNDISVEMLYQETYGGPWLSAGIREGRDHLWTSHVNIVQIKFNATTDVFGVSFVAAGMATFGHSGELISTYYEVDNLRLMDIELDAEIPNHTYIRKFAHIVDTEPSGVVASSEFVPWESEDIVTLANDEHMYPVYSGYIIPSGFIEESLVVRDGYNAWDMVATTDYPLVTESVALTGGYLTIPSGYLIIDNGVQSIYSGDGESRTEWLKDTDYVLTYDLDDNTIQTTGISSEFKTYSGNIMGEVRFRSPVAVNQMRTFVSLDVDRDIVIWIPTTGINVRTLFIGDTVENENTEENVTPFAAYTISGKAGLNLIEIEGHDPLNPPYFVGSYTYFAKRYWKNESPTSDIETNEFYLQPAPSGWAIVAGGDNLWARWLEPTGYNKVAVKFEFEGTETEAPSLRGYKITNAIDKL